LPITKLTARIREHRNMPEDIGLPSDGTERSVTISLERVPRRSLEYFRQKLANKTDRKVHPRVLNGGGSHLQKFDY
jgi:hypothetical protein